jgi:eukaryotic-like serine/threonine-protein kinase
MNAAARSADDPIGRLPLPLAQLYRRARNAKTAQDRHHHAFYLAEATLKLASSLRIGIALQSGLDAPTSLSQSLESLCLPAVGHWVGYLRETSEFLKGRPDAALQPLADQHEPLLRPDVLPAVMAFAQRASQGEHPPLTPEQARADGQQGVLGFFNLVAAYRNQVFGHGAQRLPGFYEELGPVLLQAICEVLGQECLFGGLILAVARLQADAVGRALQIEWQGLRGTASVVLPREATGPDPEMADDVARAWAGQLFFVAPGVRVAVHPLVVYLEDASERERVGFLNRTVTRRGVGGAGAMDEVRRCEYLDYNTGDQLRGIDARRELTRLLARLRGQEVHESEVDRLALASQAEPHEQHQAAVACGVTIGDFDLEGELGHGGMGVVYRARQRSLNRQVALKVLTPALAADPVALARFRREIAALARCDHPNLVKILTSGSDDQRHHFAMELVEGNNLADLGQVLAGWRKESGGPLREGHLSAAAQLSTSLHQRAPQADDTDKELDLPEVQGLLAGPAPPVPAGRNLYQRLAELFAEAADALQHLHERGVLHRDLKPGNVMLTADGKRLVIMDLGLAQLRDRSHSLTRTGTRWVGTLRYCSPEQMQRQLLDVDERADLYGLGATLYELTTLAPLFDGDSEARLVEQVLHEEPRHPRKVEPAMPADLARIIMACLDKDRTRRYASARDLADDLRRFRDGLPVRVSPLGMWQRGIKWARRRPAVAALTAFCVVALFSLVAVGWIYNAWLEGALAQTRSERDKVELEKERAVKAREATVLEKQRADENLRLARRAVDHMLSRVGQERLANEPRMQRVRKDLLEEALRFYERFLLTSGNAPPVRWETGRVQHRIGDVREMLGQHDDAEKAYRAAIAYFQELRAAAPDEAGYRHDLAATYNNLANLLKKTSRWQEAKEAYQEALELRKSLVAQGLNELDYRHDLATTENSLAVLLHSTGQRRKAELLFLDALERWQSLTKEKPSAEVYREELARVHNNLGQLRQDAGNSDEARQQFLKAIALLTKLVAGRPDDIDYRQDLALSYHHLGDLLRDTAPDQAAAAYGTAAELRQKLVTDFPLSPSYRVELAASIDSQAILFHATGNYEEAEKAYRRSVALREQLAKEFAQVPEYRNEWARGLIDLGVYLLTRARLAEAEPLFRQALTLSGALVKEFAGVPEYRHELARGYGNLAILLQATQRAPEAQAACEQALAIEAPLVEQHADVPAYQAELGRTQRNLGALCHSQGELAKAEEAYRRALDSFRRLAKKYGDVPDYRHELATTCHNLAKLLQAKQLPADAAALFDQAAGVLTALVEECPMRPAYREELTGTLFELVRTCDELGLAHLKNKQTQQAEAMFRKKVAAQKQLVTALPESAPHHGVLGHSMMELARVLIHHDKVAEAKDLIGEAIEEQWAALKTEPESAAHRAALHEHYRFCAVFLIKTGEHAEVLRIAEKLVADSRARWQEYRLAGRLAARGSTAAAKDARLDEAQRAKVADSYAERAVQFLDKAVHSGCKDLRGLQNDAELAPLRMRADFQKLLADLEATDGCAANALTRRVSEYFGVTLADASG